MHKLIVFLIAVVMAIAVVAPSFAVDRPLLVPDGVRAGVTYQFDTQESFSDAYAPFATAKVPVYDGSKVKAGLQGAALVNMKGSKYVQSNFAYGAYASYGKFEVDWATAAYHTEETGFVGDLTKGAVTAQYKLEF